MPVLYVTQPGATVRVSHGALVVTGRCAKATKQHSAREEVLLKVAPHRLETIELFGSTHVTRPALTLCLRQGIDLAWLSRNGRLLGRTAAPHSRTADLRLCQFQAFSQRAIRIELAKQSVMHKTQGAIDLLEGLQANYPRVDAICRALRQIRALRQQITVATERDHLLGLEGSAARCYYRGLAVGFRGAITFQKRSYRPATDAANALLSLGYVLLAERLTALIEARGLDPYVGFFHEPRSGRASLALDLLELFRHPVVDRFILRSCNLGQFTPLMFESDNRQAGAVRLTREGMKTFLSRWEENLTQARSAEHATWCPFVELANSRIGDLIVSIRTAVGKTPSNDLS